MSTSDHVQEHSLKCMRLAADCAQLAADTNRPVWRQHFLRMAKEWRSLAEIDPGAQDLTKNESCCFLPPGTRNCGSLFRCSCGRRSQIKWGTTETATQGVLGIRRIIRSAPCAKNCEIVDLAFLGVHQNHAAFRAREINCMIPCMENWWRADKPHVGGSTNRF
jgi:hypothetical protein